MSTVVLAVTLFTQTFPAASSAAVLTSGCSTLTVTLTTSNNTARGWCPSTAVTVASTGSATPSFTLPAGYTALALVPTNAASAATCATITGALTLTSGTPVSFTAGNNYIYCGTINALSVATFTITWTQ